VRGEELTYGDGEGDVLPVDTLFERLRGRLFGAALQRRIDFLMLCGFSRLRNSKDVRCWLMRGLASNASLAMEENRCVDWQYARLKLPGTRLKSSMF